MNGAGDKLLDDMLSEAIQGTSHPSKGEVCGEHEPIRQGVHVLLLCREEDRKKEKMPPPVKTVVREQGLRGFIEIGKDYVKANGLPAIIIALLLSFFMYQRVETRSMKDELRQEIHKTVHVAKTGEDTK